MRQLRIVDAFNHVKLVRQTLAARVKQIHFVVENVVHALEVFAHADGPSYRRATDLQDVFHFVEQFQRIAHFAVIFVHKGYDGRVAQAADVEQFDGLRFHAFGGVDDHQRAVHGGEHAVGVFREVLVAGGVQQVDGVVFIVELHHAGRHRNATLLLDFHPVGRGEFAAFFAFDRARALDCA